MTPLRGLLKRLKGETTPALDAPTRDTSSRRGQRHAVAAPAVGGGPILTEDEPRKRRRGRRGGRNRRRDGDGAQTGTPEASRTSARADRAEDADRAPNGGDSRARGRRSENPSTTSSTTSRSGRTGNGRSRGSSSNGRSGASTNDKPAGRSSNGNGNGNGGNGGGEGYRWGRRVESGEADERSRRANRRRRDVRVRNLDAPLPEDIAFRPGQEGGDSSILPSRRRRPTGLHDTARVLVGGARTIGAWVKRDERHGEDHPGPYTFEDLHAPAEEGPAEGKPAAAVTAGPRLRPAVEVAPTTDDPESDDADSADSVDSADSADLGEADESGEAPRRRRRGRRGGRGRRRPSVEADGLTLVEDPAAEADDDDDHEVEQDEDEEDALVQPVADDDDDSDLDDLDDLGDEDADDVEAAPRAERRPRRRAQRAPIADEDLPAAFAKLGAGRVTLETLAGWGFQEPTPIQVEAIPALMNNLDVVGIAQTGSGKTVAFGVPMMERLDPDLPEVQGIVLVPTRELAQQVLDVLSDLAAPWGLTAVGLLGGRSLKADFRALDGRPHIVVGTPGRILDHLRRQTLSLRHVSYAVLDEADQMLDIGFLPDIRRILSRTPQRRQTALFSATMPGSIKRLIWQFMTDPETIRVDAEATPVDTITQVYFEVANRDKVRAMRELIERELKGRTLIFCNMKRGVDHLARELARDGVRVGALHGDMDQRHRDQVVREFRGGSLDVLIATNVAARGLDIPEITHVVNYDVPQNLEEYVHRIGRTGRAGRDGKAITFVCEWDVDGFDVISKNIGVEIARDELDLYARTSKPASASTEPEIGDVN